MWKRTKFCGSLKQRDLKNPVPCVSALRDSVLERDDTAAVVVHWRKRKRKEVMMMMMMICS